MRTPLLLTLGILALTAAGGCRESAESPTAPATDPVRSVTAATTALAFRQVSAGWLHTCGVTTDDRAYCWGDNASGELGNGTIGGYGDYATTPVAVAGTRRFRSVSAGHSFTCGVTTGDVLFCWGYNFHGQLGNGTNTGSPRPVRVASGIRFRQVAAGANHVCAVSIGDIVFCWGYNAYGAVGDGTTTERWVPTRPAGWGHFSKVSVGNLHSCGLTTANLAYCWGLDGYGQLGDGSYHGQQLKPTAVAGGLTFDQVQAGYFHTCGVTTNHRAYCWGNNGTELGSMPGNDSLFQQTPRLVAGKLAFRAVDASYYHTCGVTTDSRAYCWGQHALGNGSEGGSPTPVRVAGGLLFRQVSTGYYIGCGVTTDSRVYCWGSSPYGLTPTLVTGAM